LLILSNFFCWIKQKLEAGSLEAAQWADAERNLQFEAIRASQEVKAALAALQNAESVLEAVRLRCDASMRTAAERDSAIARAGTKLSECDEEVRRNTTSLREAKIEHSVEDAVSSVLQTLLKENLNHVAGLEAQVVAVKVQAKKAADSKRAAQAALHRAQKDASKVEIYVTKAKKNTECVAEELAALIQHRKELEAAIEEIRREESGHVLRRHALDGLVTAEKCRLKSLKGSKSNLIGARNAASTRLKVSKGRRRQIAIDISRAIAERSALRARRTSIRSKIESHEANLYHVELCLLVRQSAIRNAREDASSSVFDHKTSSLVARKRQLEKDRALVAAERASLKNIVSKARTDYEDVVSLLDEKKAKAGALRARREVAELNVQQAHRICQCRQQAKAALRLQLDKTRVSLVMYKQRTNEYKERLLLRKANIRQKTDETRVASAELMRRVE